MNIICRSDGTISCLKTEITTEINSSKLYLTK
jgi:hypothetical protein